MGKKKGNKAETKAAAKSAPAPAGKNGPEQVGQPSEEKVGCGTEVGSEPIAQQLDEDKADQAAGQQEPQVKQQTQQQTGQQKPQLQQLEQEQKQEKEIGQETEWQENPAEALQPTAAETAKAHATCDPEQEPGNDPTELLNLLKELGEADPDSLLGSEEVPANVVNELLENGDLLEQLARTANELDALSNKFADMGEKMASEHLQFEERLQSAEEQARNEALDAAKRRDKFHQLQLDTGALMTQLTQAQDKLAPTIGAAIADTVAVETTPLAENAPGAAEDAAQEDAAEKFEDASGQSQEDEPRHEFAEARGGLEDEEADEEQDNEREKPHEDNNEEASDEEEESIPENAEKKGWLGGWFKK
mmetsp:Transcript_88814/g.176559  ORF Transcript_88814/g.176559 Transcript_88814/m.176559 type:complete len:362 (-) Transcript_88814:43-1128(-)